MKVTDHVSGAAALGLLKSLLSLLEKNGIIDRSDTLHIFDHASASLRNYPDNPVSLAAAQIIDTLSAETRGRH